MSIGVLKTTFGWRVAETVLMPSYAHAQAAGTATGVRVRVCIRTLPGSCCGYRDSTWYANGFILLVESVAVQ